MKKLFLMLVMIIVGNIFVSKIVNKSKNKSDKIFQIEDISGIIIVKL